ncbi:MAG TPA: hypothetical protein VEX38_08415, partial [Fimbriimonadaceae bacterium]|nr:hypothetical protein [Fimbriimonadaceae bacterium]
MRLSPLIPVLVLLALITTAYGQSPTFEKILSTPRVDSPAISPDGKWVAYGITTPDWKENAFRVQIWLYDAEKKRSKQLSRGAGVGSFSWSPKGDLIAFTASRGGASQIYLLDPFGGEAAKLTDVKEGVGGIEWSPDGTKI